MANYYGVSFKNDGKVYYFKSEEFTCPINVTVIVETLQGLQFGKVVSKVDKVDNIDIENIKPILRIADKKDYNQYLSNVKDAKEALQFANSNAKKLNLNMHIIDSSMTFDRKQLLISFVSDERIDFRELAKLLASKYHMRIELRQVGARDKARSIGGIGVCGHELCCKRFLSKIEPITINMAKNQNIALNPSKINGACGRLLCCLTYEDDMYTSCIYGMPQVGNKVKTEYGDGVVISIDILNRKYKVNINNEIKEIELKDNERSKK